MWFPIETATAIVVNGVYEIDFPTHNVDRLLHWITLNGPAFSAVSVYLDTVYLDNTDKGDTNRADYIQGIPIAKGRVLRLIWDTGTGSPTPSASIGCSDGGQETQQALTGQYGLFARG